MKSVKNQLKGSPAIGLFVAGMILLACSCSLEQPVDPFDRTGEGGDQSGGGMITITLDEDSTLWSWGKYRTSLPGDSAKIENIQPMKLESE